MKLIVTEENLILETNEGSYTMKRTFEEEDWHIINEFVDLCLYRHDDDTYNAYMFLVEDGAVRTDLSYEVEVELANI